MGATLTYYYNVVEPGTYMYHCHVEAAEHMQMGMLGNLYVKPGQNECLTNTAYDCPTGHADGDEYAYNDGDGSTSYDAELALQISSIDPIFHDASLATQPLPFADMRDTYTLFNGRGYPTTVDGYKTAANVYGGTPGVTSFFEARPGPAQDELDGYVSQKTSAFKKVSKGDRLLVRVSNLSITKFNTVTFMGLPVEVVGQGGRQLEDSYRTTSVNLGGGEAFDVIIDTTDVPVGDYFVYVTELHELSNNEQSFGGPMTIIQVSN
jgi:FtsP/CotA-like multicopper oxidase with cupredoxin domain